MIIPVEEKMTKENFDPDKYKDQLREQGMREDVLDDMIAKKKEQLNKDEDIPFEYVIKLEEVSKADDEHLIIAGFASSENLDWDDEAVNQDSLKAAWADYMTNPVLRYMHGKDNRNPDAIGKVLESYTTADGQTLKTEFKNNKPFIVAEVSNAPDVESIRCKIKEGVLKGFSIGGRANRVSEFCTRVGKNINRIFVKRMSELSIVDLPANKDGMFSVIKGCMGNNCSCNIDEIINDNLNESTPKVNDDNYQDEITKTEENNMSENIEMGLDELEEFVKSTVSKMIIEQEQVEKVEEGAVAVAEAQNLRARIAELEAEVTKLAAELKARPQEAMKSEKIVDAVVVEDIEKSELDLLKVEVAELKATPMYKAEQVEKTEEIVAPTSHLTDVIRAHYGGN